MVLMMCSTPRMGRCAMMCQCAARSSSRCLMPYLSARGSGLSESLGMSRVGWVAKKGKMMRTGGLIGFSHHFQWTALLFFFSMVEWRIKRPRGCIPFFSILNRIFHYKPEGNYLVDHPPDRVCSLVHPSFVSGWSPYLSHWKQPE